MNILSMIPLHYRIIGGLAILLMIIAAAEFDGAARVNARWQEDKAKQAAAAAAILEKQGEATVKVVTEYVDRVKVVREKGDTIIKEVPVYVPAQADAACTINRGFVRLHDAAAANQIPEPAGVADAAPSGITLSTAAGTIAGNYERCSENAEQLRALQEWVRGMQEAESAP